MILFIETCLDDFFIGTYDEKTLNNLEYIHKENFKKKSDFLPEAFSKVVGENIWKISAIYVTSGPGSFMGIRAGLLFSVLISKLRNIKLFTATTFDLLAIDNKIDDISIKAGGNFVYKFVNNKHTITEGKPNGMIDYQNLFKSFKTHKNAFVVTDPNSIEPNYIKEPTIG